MLEISIHDTQAECAGNKLTCVFSIQNSIGRYFFKDLLRYPLGKEGVYAQDERAFLAHTKQKVSNIVDLTVLRLAFFKGYE